MGSFHSIYSTRAGARSRNSAVSPPLVKLQQKRANDFSAAATLDAGIPALVESYHNPIPDDIPHPPSYNPSKTRSLESFSKAITANLLGGIGYFYGTSIVDRGFAHEWDQDDEFDFKAKKSGDEDDEAQSGAKLTEPRGSFDGHSQSQLLPQRFLLVRVLN